MSAAAHPAPALPDILASYRAARTRWPALVLVVALHGGLFMMPMWAAEPTRQLALRPVMISATIRAPEPAPAVVPPEVILPPPRPEPVLAIPERLPRHDAQEPAVDAAPEPTQAEPIMPASPAEMHSEPEAASESLAQVPAPPPVAPPRFDADYLDNPAPAYPGLSRRLGEQGTVLLRVYVDPAGSPARIELKQSSGYPRLDSAALGTVKRWRFVPARAGAAAVGGWVIVPVSFNLRS